MAARDDAYINFEKAIEILQTELKYPYEKAVTYVDRFDRNKDGKLSISEFQSFHKSFSETKRILLPRFQEYDKDNNGYINLQEASQILQEKPFNFPANKVVHLLKQFDLDGNGRLDIEEFADFYSNTIAMNKKMQENFDKLDVDKNGVLDLGEVKDLIQTSLGLDDKCVVTLVEMFDANKDGQLDKAEFINLWSTMFPNTNA